MSDQNLASQWAVIHHLLDLANRAGLGELFALRGSLLLKAWYGNNAREPGDIDWVWANGDDRIASHGLSKGRFTLFLRLVMKHPATCDVTIAIRKITDAPISDNDEYRPGISGRRLTFPWRDATGATGAVQVDFALYDYNDIPLVTVSRAAIPNRATGVPTYVTAVSKEDALLWKLRWLDADATERGAAQGKDLYDAVLLAEDIRLPVALFVSRLPPSLHDYTQVLLTEPSGLGEFPLMWNVDWESFQQAHPQIDGSAMDWQIRLTLALAPTFSDSEQK